VAIYHIWLGRVSGGVDVFLFISAFLLTGTFTRRLETGRPLGIPRYWVKTFKRLLPPSLVTIVAVLVLAYFILPPTIWTEVQHQAVGSAFYVQNYVLAASSVDYYAHDAAAASPLQHFWSLSIQGQIFLIWPLLFALAALLIKRCPRLRNRPRRLMTGIFAPVFVVSLIWSIHSTQTDQAFAYFDTTARLWEFAAGSLLGILLPFLDRNTGATRSVEHAPHFATARAVLGWVGLAGLVSCGIVLDVAGVFPGWIALWPLGAAGLVIAAGYSGKRWGADRALALRPVAFLGSISYGLYLVHWPVLIAWLAISDRPRAGVLDGLLVLVASIAIAWLLTWAVDSPIRRSAWIDARPMRGASVVAASLVVITVASQVAFPAATRAVLAGDGEPTVGVEDLLEDPSEQATAVASHPGAQWATYSDSPLTAGSGDPIPGPDDLQSPRFQLSEDCTGIWGTEKEVYCRHSVAPEAKDGEEPLTILVAGDSHADQYVTGVLAAVGDKPWTVWYVGRGGCYLGDVEDRTTKKLCGTINPAWPDILDTVDPDLVITTGSRSKTTADGEYDRGSLPRGLDMLADRGIPTLLLRDNPRYEDNQYDCVFDALREGGTAVDADAKCGSEMNDKLAEEDPSAHWASDDPYAPVTVADPSTDVLCPDGHCYPMMGNIILYRDDDHLTGEFTATMGPWFEPKIEEALAKKTSDTPPASDGGGDEAAADDAAVDAEEEPDDE
jgi:peptidoglycan/LPS O-acetylase OafA/YrhL